MIRSILAPLLLTPLLAAPMQAGGNSVKGQRGMVRAVNPERGWYALVPDRDPGTRYAPDPPLPEAFRQDGLRVVFSGRVKPAPDGVRLWGTPLKVTRLVVEKPRK